MLIIIIVIVYICVKKRKQAKQLSEGNEDEKSNKLITEKSEGNLSFDMK